MKCTKQESVLIICHSSKEHTMRPLEILLQHKVIVKLEAIIDKVNKIFTNEDELRHIDDNRYVLSKGESGTRITLLLLTSCAVLIGMALLVIGLIMFKANAGSFGVYVYDQENQYNNPINMNLNLVYYLGAHSFFIDLGYTKNNSFAINKIRKLSWDACGIFGMFDGTSLNVYLGSEGQKTRTFDVNNWQVRIIENDFTPFAFDNDATIVNFNHYIWVIGESVGCDIQFGASNECSAGKYKCCDLTNKNNIYSYVWSISKKRWRSGPSVKPIKDMNLFFVNTCAVTLNKTSVLFIGLVKNYKGAINSLEANDSTTAIYNFEFNQWTLQDYLTYKDIKEEEIHPGYTQFTQERSCAMIQDKDGQRIIAISFLSKAFGLPQKNYAPYAWMSNVDRIEWTSMEMGNFPVGGMISGTIASFKGMLFYFIESHHQDLGFSYKIKITDNKMVFEPIFTSGWNHCKEVSVQGICLKISTHCKSYHSNEKVISGHKCGKQRLMKRNGRCLR